MKEGGFRIIVQLSQKGRMGQPGAQYKWEVIPQDEQSRFAPPARAAQQLETYPQKTNTPSGFFADAVPAIRAFQGEKRNTSTAETSRKAEEKPTGIEAQTLTNELAGTLAIFILQEARQNKPEFYEGDDILESCHNLVNRWFHDSFGHLPTIQNSFRAAKEDLSNRSVDFESTDYEELWRKDPFMGDFVLWLHLQNHYANIRDTYLTNTPHQTPNGATEEFLTDIYNQWNTQGRSFRAIPDNPAQVPVNPAEQNKDISVLSTRVEKAIPPLREKIQACLDEIAQKNITGPLAGPQIQALFPRLSAPGRFNSSDVKVALDKGYITPLQSYDGRGHPQYEVSEIAYLLAWHDLRREFPFMTVYTRNIHKIIKDEIAAKAEADAAIASTTSSNNLAFGK